MLLVWHNREDKTLATRVILVRHGESTFNIESRVQGHGDFAVLTEKGIWMASQVGKALAGINFAAIYSSPLQRARHTAKLIVEQLQTQATVAVPQPQVLSNLIEIDLPQWEGLLFSEIREKYPEAYSHWKCQPQLLKMQRPNGEEFYPVGELYQQAQAVWQALLARHTHETILLVAHSGINRALIGTALGLTPESYLVLQQANCAISVLNFAGGWGTPAQLESLNQTHHLGIPLPTPRSGEQWLRLLLVRHGETDWNRQGRFQGQIDVPLNDNGYHQGAKVAEFLREMPIDFAVSSPMLRPRATAEAILQHHPQVSLQFLDGLREISHGDWEGKLEAEVEAEFPGELGRWRHTPEQVQMPNGENLQQVWDRSVAAWNQIVAAAKADAAKAGSRSESSPPKLGLVVAHDAVNKAILCYLAGLKPDAFWSFKQGNGAVSVIDYPLDETASPLLQATNITSHLTAGVLDRTAAGAL